MIEDTESTIDLAAHGWTLHNYPERLAYSATPPDFGSLCIQRHRWANGGLLIIPKLVRAVRQRRAARRAHQHRRAAAAPELHGVDLLELAVRAVPDGDPVQRPPDLTAHLRGRGALLPGDGRRPALLRLQAPRRGPHLRLQPAAAAGQPRGQPQLDRAGPDRRQGQLHAHPEGARPHGSGVRLRRAPLRAGRLLGLHLQAGLGSGPLGQRRLRRDQRPARRLRDRRVHRPAQLARRHLGQRASRGSTSPSATARRRRAPAGRPRLPRGRRSPTGSWCSTWASPTAAAALAT